MAEKKKQTEWQKRFSAAFRGDKLELKKTINGQDQSPEAKAERAEARKRKGIGKN